MKRILILFAHPNSNKSQINRKMINAVDSLEGITVNNLYENYPDFYIDIVREQQLLLLHDVIVWHHPFYWYSSPSLLKEWFDLVLRYGFAYGKNGNALKGKCALSVITTGGSGTAYTREGKNKFTINQFLAPFEQSANLCKMIYLAPFVVHDTYNISHSGATSYAEQYKKLIVGLRDKKISCNSFQHYQYANDLLEKYV
ncbi:MAG: NAD(P)H oxidoreductase [Draconibacterium sp.]|nr:MAG: NAD(P)H oxidoreductase [Draconibacterium sp.]PIF05567.1 MAG: NAD(P)H oxidoreductase [Draconibacterium sp.]